MGICLSNTFFIRINYLIISTYRTVNLIIIINTIRYTILRVNRMIRGKFLILYILTISTYIQILLYIYTLIILLTSNTTISFPYKSNFKEFIFNRRNIEISLYLAKRRFKIFTKTIKIESISLLAQ